MSPEKIPARTRLALAQKVVVYGEKGPKLLYYIRITTRNLVCLYSVRYRIGKCR